MKQTLRKSATGLRSKVQPSAGQIAPALVAEYKRVMIPREVLQETFDRYLGLPAAKEVSK